MEEKEMTFNNLPDNMKDALLDWLKKDSGNLKNEIVSAPKIVFDSGKGELWSWLKKDSKRQQFFSEEGSDLPEEEFVEKIAGKIQENYVPAEIHKQMVEWDRSKVNREVYIIKPTTNAANPLTSLIQFKHVGKFSYVEEKTFITPPNLPEAPGRKKGIDPMTLKMTPLLYTGLGLILLGFVFFTIKFLIGLVLVLIGAGCAYFGYKANKEIKEIKEYNARVEKQELAWEFAWQKWRDTIFVHSFQEDINGEISRVYDAVFECIKQVSNDVFQKETISEQKESTDMNNLEQLISRRKSDYR